MIRIECDNCEQPFEVPEAEAGSKTPCPHCGDINRIPASAELHENNHGRGEEKADFADTPDESREREICTIRPAMFRARPFKYGAIVLLLLGGGVLAITAAVKESMGSWLVWPGLLAIVAAGGWFGWWWLSTHFWMKLVVTNKRTVRHEGIIRRHTTEVLHDHVRSVDINQKFLQRMFSVGTIGIDSAGQDGIEIEVHDIPRPYEVKKIIDRYRKM